MIHTRYVFVDITTIAPTIPHSKKEDSTASTHTLSLTRTRALYVPEQIRKILSRYISG